MVGRSKFKAKAPQKPFEPVYFFGYGSLLWPPGINGRGMRKYYTEADLIPARLHGYCRSFCAYFQGRNFYGILPKAKSTVNGVIFPINNLSDYRALLSNEGALKAYGKHQVYWATRITNKMEYLAPFTLTKGWRIITLVCHENRTDGNVSPWYVDKCHTYAAKWGDAFLKEFLATGGWTIENWNAWQKRHHGAMASTS